MTPVGNPVAERLTALVNPPTSVTVIVVVEVVPWASDMAVGKAESTKLGATLTVIATGVLDVILPVAASEAVTVAV